MRSALLFAIRLSIPAIVLAYVVAMLASACMPLADALGAAQAIPRWEFWFLYASVPSAIGWQWTGGLQPITLSDRLPIFVATAIWLLGCWWLGKWILRCDPVEARLSKYERFGVAILVGQSALASIVFLYGSLVGTNAFVWLLGFLILTAIGLWRFRLLKSPVTPPIEQARVLDEEPEEDVSFASSISRRMVGLLVLATTFLACIQVVGATIPTQDMHVREVDWWIAKHAALDGRLHWSSENALANAPAGFTMPSVAFVGFLTMDLPSISSADSMGTIQQRARWNSRLRTGVLAGKTVNAVLCLVGVFLASVHVGRRWGYLQGLFVGFLLVATPGIAELTRLGRTEALLGIWSAALLVVWHAAQESRTSKLPLGLVWGFLLAGAFGSGYGSGVVVGVPAVFLWIWSHRRRELMEVEPHPEDTLASTLPNQFTSRESEFTTRESEAPAELAPHWFGRSLTLPLLFKRFNRREVSKPSLMTTVLFVGVLVAASAFYLRNLVASGDPIYPWGGVVAQQLGLVKHSDLRDSLIHAYRVPSQTTSESIAAMSSDTASLPASNAMSAYRWDNWQDGILRLLGNSSAHGLMLVPFAMVGIFSGRFVASRVAILWFVYWVSTWWCFSMRQDRDWVGALILLSWPASAGAHWMAKQLRGLWMLFFVVIAILWSVVVIPIWPTSDNRMFVALESLDSDSLSPVGSKLADEDAALRLTYSSQFNAKVRQGFGFTSDSKLLLIGENDDFNLLTDCVSNGAFDRGLLDKWRNLPTKEVGTLLRSHGISHVMVVWSGVQYRERLTGRETESKYRTALSELLSDSQLRSIPWEINSSQAELFLVIQE